MLSVVPSSVRSDDSFLLSDFETIEHEKKTKEIKNAARSVIFFDIKNIIARDFIYRNIKYEDVY